MQLFADWPWPAIMTAGGSAAALIATYTKPVFAWLQNRQQEEGKRKLSLEQEIALLRVALGKSQRREGGATTACEILILGLQVSDDERAVHVRSAREALESCLKREGV